MAVVLELKNLDKNYVFFFLAQPIGQPEISRMSLSELCVNQTSDLFIIGKNFLKGTKILFQELGADETDIKWQSEADIEVEYFQQVCVSPCAE